MKQCFYLFKRGRIYYLQDSSTGKQSSLKTTDREEAEQLLQTKLQSVRQPMLNLALAKTLLAAADPELPNRTWQTLIDEFIARSGRESTKSRRRRALGPGVFDIIRTKRLTETSADDLRSVLNAGGAFTNNCLRCLHNLAVGLGWLPWPMLPSKLWPTTKPKHNRAITWEEHQRIILKEKNGERRLYYELLWEIGASQTDAAMLGAENADLETRVLTYERLKTGERASVTIGATLEKILRQLPSTGPLFPRIVSTTANARAAEFRRRCRSLNLRGISLHSYRYAWAERARKLGYPERFAQEALGHNSKAVHRAYAKNAQLVIPSLEHFATETQGPARRSA